jgi:hypothetical protein
VHLLVALLLLAEPTEAPVPYEVGAGVHYGIFLNLSESSNSVDVLAAWHVSSIFAVRVRIAYALNFLGVQFNDPLSGPGQPVAFVQAVPDLQATVCRTPRTAGGVMLECWIAAGAGVTGGFQRPAILSFAPSFSAETGFDVRLPFLPDVYLRPSYGLDLMHLPLWDLLINNRFGLALVWRYGAAGL